jgi:hypothetical protein
VANTDPWVHQRHMYLLDIVPVGIFGFSGDESVPQRMARRLRPPLAGSARCLADALAREVSEIYAGSTAKKWRT